MTQTQPRSLRTIAGEVYADWKNVHYAARPYLEAMTQLERVTDNYGYDTGKGVVLYFLSNASTWRGPVAKRIKAELKQMVESK